MTYELRGVVERPILYNRAGLCVLHPIREYGGREFSGRTPGGEISGVFPRLVAPQAVVDGVQRALFPPVSALRVVLANRVVVTLDFLGSLFETEDQRNWADASFKSYCNPLLEPFPRQASAGSVIAQSVAIRVDSGLERLRRRVRTRTRIAVGDPLGRRAPMVGVWASSGAQDVDASRIELLRSMRLGHIRFDLDAADARVGDSVRAVQAVAAQVTVPQELVLRADGAASGTEQALASLAEALEPAPTARVIVCDAEREMPERETVELVRRAVPAAIPVGSGSSGHFVDLNRRRPEAGVGELVCWPVMAQAHASDELSMVEGLEAQSDIVWTARRFADGRALVASPVTLRAWPADPELGEDIERSPFAAAWTLGSFKHLAEAGLEAVTFHRVHDLFHPSLSSGPCDRATSDALRVTPLYRALVEIASVQGAPVCWCSSTDPLVVKGVALGTRSGRVLLLANMRHRGHRVELAGVRGRRVLVRRLNPDAWSATASDSVAVRDRRDQVASGALRAIDLLPYEIVRIDMEGG